jgi:uncharacterized BrkB/YihY/UPF0761 family membrane protein
MDYVLTYFITLIVIVIAVFVTLYFKSELERMFREKEDVLPFHICNVVIILMVSLGANACLTYYVFENKLNMALQLVILIFMTLPLYLLGNWAFEKYKTVYRKYTPGENKKVVVLNQKYLKKKKTFLESPSVKNYNAVFSKDETKAKK